MNLQLNDKWTLSSDAKNFIIEKKKIYSANHKFAGQEHWETVGYYQSIDKALSGVLRHESAGELGVTSRGEHRPVHRDLARAGRCSSHLVGEPGEPGGTGGLHVGDSSFLFGLLQCVNKVRYQDRGDDSDDRNDDEQLD